MTDININKCDISGKVSMVKPCGKATYLTVEQKVAGRLDTAFRIVCAAASGIDVKEGDQVLLLGAVCYQSEKGDFRFRISDSCQIAVLSRALDLGTTQAEDIFS